MNKQTKSRHKYVQKLKFKTCEIQISFEMAIDMCLGCMVKNQEFDDKRR